MLEDMEGTSGNCFDTQIEEATIAGFALMRELGAEATFRGSPPPELCHYTDFAGLHGILQTHQLWATYARALNDSTEQQFGKNVIEEYIRSRLSHDANEVIVTANRRPRRNFVTCFCEDSRILSMWRAYAGQGGGFCLEFSGPELMLCRFPPHQHRLVFQLTYGSPLPSVSTQVLDRLCDFAQQGRAESIVASAWFGLIAMKIKHQSFREEREWRIVIAKPDLSKVNFRPGPEDIKPYVSLMPTMPDGSSRLPLKRIVYGPTLRDDETLTETLALMLERYGYSNVEVCGSGIPYRL